MMFVDIILIRLGMWLAIRAIERIERRHGI